MRYTNSRQLILGAALGLAAVGGVGVAWGSGLKYPPTSAAVAADSGLTGARPNPQTYSAPVDTVTGRMVDPDTAAPQGGAYTTRTSQSTDQFQRRHRLAKPQ
jgi:hypothetical protein